MKLPDFLQDATWNQLRRAMGAELVPFSPVVWKEVNADDLLQRLIKGIEVDLSEIQIDEDTGFSYQGKKVLVYIRDQRVHPGYTNTYRFHLCNCSTIEEFRSKDQLERFVVSRRVDGVFIVNEFNTVTRQYIAKGVPKKLSVCKKCLMQLRYKGYSDYVRHAYIHRNFKLEEFFQQYENSQFHTEPNHYADEAPDDAYTPDFSAVSLAYRESRKWTCEECDLKFADDKASLHTHHKNGIRSDNRRENLRALCVACHAEQPGHERMKFQPEYRSFLNKYRLEWESRRYGVF